MSGMAKKHSDSFQSCYWCKIFIKILSLQLGIPLADQSTFIPHNLSLSIHLVFKNPLGAYYIFICMSRNQLPSVIFLNLIKLLINTIFILNGLLKILRFHHRQESDLRLFLIFDQISSCLHSFIIFTNYLNFRMILLNDHGRSFCFCLFYWISMSVSTFII